MVAGTLHRSLSNNLPLLSGYCNPQFSHSLKLFAEKGGTIGRYEVYVFWCLGS